METLSTKGTSVTDLKTIFLLIIQTHHKYMYTILRNLKWWWNDFEKILHNVDELIVRNHGAKITADTVLTNQISTKRDFDYI